MRKGAAGCCQSLSEPQTPSCCLSGTNPLLPKHPRWEAGVFSFRNLCKAARDASAQKQDTRHVPHVLSRAGVAMLGVTPYSASSGPKTP